MTSQFRITDLPDGLAGLRLVRQLAREGVSDAERGDSESGRSKLQDALVRVTLAQAQIMLNLGKLALAARDIELTRSYMSLALDQLDMVGLKGHALGQIASAVLASLPASSGQAG